MLMTYLLLLRSYINVRFVFYCFVKNNLTGSYLPNTNTGHKRLHSCGCFSCLCTLVTPLFRNPGCATDCNRRQKGCTEHLDLSNMEHDRYKLYRALTIAARGLTFKESPCNHSFFHRRRFLRISFRYRGLSSFRSLDTVYRSA